MSWLSPGRWLLCLAAIAALVVGYIAWADHIGDQREAKVRAEYQAQADEANAKRAAIAEPIVKKEAAAQARVRTVTETLIKKIPVYVKVTDCPMPGGFRVLHDKAAHGELPDTTAPADGASVPAQTVTETVLGNYGTCHQTAERLTALQEWVRAQAELKTGP